MQFKASFVSVFGVCYGMKERTVKVLTVCKLQTLTAVKRRINRRLLHPVREVRKKGQDPRKERRGYGLPLGREARVW